VVDEYNRIPTKTQSALLSLLAEGYAEMFDQFVVAGDSAWFLTANDDQGGGTFQVIEALKDRIEEVLKALTYREREIIKLRYGIGDGYTYTLEEVERIFKVTRERVRQVEAKAIRKLQHPVRARKLEGFLDRSAV